MEKFENKDFLKLLKPIHKNHTANVYKKLMKKIYTLKQSLKKRSKEHNVECSITSNEIKIMFSKYYGKKCKYCNKKVLTIKTIACDHIMPLVKNGTSTKDNLQLICKTCNTRKGPLDEKDFLLFLRWIRKQNNELKGYVLRKMSKGGKY